MWYYRCWCRVGDELGLRLTLSNGVLTNWNPALEEFQENDTEVSVGSLVCLKKSGQCIIIHKRD